MRAPRRRRRFRFITRRSFLTFALSLAFVRRTYAEGAQTLYRADGTPIEALVIGAPSPGEPVAVLSHGLGGSCRSLLWLAETLAAQGFLCVLPTHVESSRLALRDAVRQKLTGASFRSAVAAKLADPDLEKARSADIAAALATADPTGAAPFRVLLGHSMGAAAAIIEAGAETSFGRIGRDAFDAYVAISPEGPGSLFPPEAWRNIAKPVLFVTGTRDRGTEGDWAWRASAFDLCPPGGKRIGVIPGAGHLQLGGLSEPRVHRVLFALTHEFLDQARSGDFAPSRIEGALIREK